MMRRQCHLDLASSRSLQDHLLLATHSQNFASELRGQTYARNFLIATYGHTLEFLKHAGLAEQVDAVGGSETLRMM